MRFRISPSQKQTSLFENLKRSRFTSCALFAHFCSVSDSNVLQEQFNQGNAHKNTVVPALFESAYFGTPHSPNKSPIMSFISTQEKDLHNLKPRFSYLSEMQTNLHVRIKWGPLNWKNDTANKMSCLKAKIMRRRHLWDLCIQRYILILFHRLDSLLFISVALEQAFTISSSFGEKTFESLILSLCTETAVALR